VRERHAEHSAQQDAVDGVVRGDQRDLVGREPGAQALENRPRPIFDLAERFRARPGRRGGSAWYACFHPGIQNSGFEN